MEKLIQADSLQSFVATIFIASGSMPPEAEQVAANLVLANLSGHDSHGVGMVPRYVAAVAEGGLRPNHGVAVRADTGSLLALDGQCGYGQVVGPQAMALGIERALAHGSCIVSLAQAHHLGRIGHFAEQATAAGLVSMHFVNVLSRPVVAPWGGGDGRFGTNPCCIGVPLPGEEPFILDFATSRVAQGKMRVAHNKGERVPPGFLIDAQGTPTDDPAVVVVPQPPSGLFGALMTFGEHKGYGMAVACELLGGALSGGGTWHKPAEKTSAVLNGMLTVLIDPEKLGTADSFAAESRAFVDWLRQSPAAPGSPGVQLAGEPERACRAERRQHGIAVDAQTRADIVRAAASVGVPAPAFG